MLRSGTALRLFTPHYRNSPVIMFDEGTTARHDRARPDAHRRRTPHLDAAQRLLTVVEI